jgi:hypothetical protein
MFGVYGQGSTNKGMKFSNASNCAQRFMQITVTPGYDMNSTDVVLLEAGTYDFYST